MSITYNPENDIPDLSGKVIVITGGKPTNQHSHSVLTTMLTFNPQALLVSAKKLSSN